MTLTILISLISIFIYLYVLWFKLKEDYSASLIFSAGFSIAFFVIASNLIALRFFPEYWFWLSAISVVLGVVFSVKRFGLSFYEFADAVIISLHPWLGLTMLDRFASSQDPKILIIFTQVVFTAIVYIIFDKHYRSFTWYRSGRVGFSGLSVLGIFFLSRAAIALALGDMISFIGLEDAIISGAVSFISFLGLFNLARSKY